MQKAEAAAEAESSDESGESHLPQPPEPHSVLRLSGFSLFMVWLLLLLMFEYWTKGWFQKAGGLGGHSGPTLWLHQVFYDLISTHLPSSHPFCTSLLDIRLPTPTQASCKIPIHPSWLCLRFSCSEKSFLYSSLPPHPHPCWSRWFFSCCPNESCADFSQSISLLGWIMSVKNVRLAC